MVVTNCDNDQSQGIMVVDNGLASIHIYTYHVDGSMAVCKIVEPADGFFLDNSVGPIPIPFCFYWELMKNTRALIQYKDVILPV